VSGFNSASMKGLIVSPTFCTAAGIIDDNTPWAMSSASLLPDGVDEPHAGKDLVRSVTRNLLPTRRTSRRTRPLSGVQDIAFPSTTAMRGWKCGFTMQPAKLPQAILVEMWLAAENRPGAVEPITMGSALGPGAHNQATQTSGGGL
jgi:hypothetical protein